MKTRKQLRMRWLALVLVVLSWTGVACAAEPATHPAQVVRVVSGQTLEVLLPNGPAEPQTVRLLGLDAPDLRQEPWGEAAQAYLAEWLEGQTVGLEPGVEPADSYGRQLAYVWQDGQLVNERMIAQGWGLAIARAPNLRYDDRFQQAQMVARALGRGIWNPDQPLRQTPTEFRQSLPDAS